MSPQAKLVLISFAGLMIVVLALSSAAAFIYYREQANLPPATAPASTPPPAPTRPPASVPDPDAADKGDFAFSGGWSLVLVVLLVLAGLFALGAYLMPLIIAAVRHHPFLAPIAVINLLLGWSFVGWTVSSARALSPIALDRRYRYW